MAVNFDHNQDGSVIVKITPPVSVRGESVDRATIPAIRGKHMRSCPFTLSDMGNGEVPAGKMVEWAALIVLPAGVVDELDPLDALSVGSEVAVMMGKPRATGAGA